MIAGQVDRSGAFYSGLFGNWVHASVGNDEALRARHASLIASHVLGGALSAVVFAVYFLWSGAPGAAATIAALCFLSQIGIGLYLSRSGALEIAHLLAAANLTALVSIAAGLSGGSASFAVAWLVIIPLEAALSADRRMMILATLLAITALVCLHLATIAGALPAPVALPIDGSSLALVAHLGAAVYAGALAASVQQIHRGAEHEIETGREAYRLIAENANDLITRHDAAGRVTFASLASRHLLGLEPERLMTTGFASLLDAADRDRLQASMHRCLADAVPVSEELCVRRQRPDGTGEIEIWMEMRCQPIAGPDRQGSIVAVTRDITRRKAEVAELARARDEAERASRAKTTFLATMSHELRTPLNSIIGFAELLHRDALIKNRDPKQAEQCRIIHQSGEHLLSLVKDLLDVSKIESGKFSVVPDPFAIDEVAPEAALSMRPLADAKGIKLACDIPDDLPDMLADRRAVRQILINLVSNAVKFTGTGGEVRVAAKRIGPSIELSVADTGRGIAPEHIARLGQPFFQIDTRYARDNEGAGLGLSIVRGLVELHGGRLTIESTPGKGSRFAVELPADVEAVEPATVEPATVAHNATRRTAVIVDLADLHRRQQERQPAGSAMPDGMPPATGTTG